MAEKIFARQTIDGLWQWRRATAEGQWHSDVYHTGDNEALAESMEGRSVPVTLLMPGQEVVMCEVDVESQEKRHLAKLLPYELEEQVIDSIDEVHMAFGVISDNTVPVSYASNELIRTSLEELVSQSLDVRVIAPDYLCLRIENQGVTLVMDGNRLLVRTGKYRGFAVETFLAPQVLAQQTLELDFTATVSLVAEDEQRLTELRSWLPRIWTEENGPEISEQVGSFWDWIDPEVESPINLRSGEFSRQVPIKRWALLWKTPLIAAAAAYLIAVMVTFAQYQSAKQEQRSLVQQMNDVYLQAVPNGRKGDPEGALRALVQGIKGGSEPSNLMALINGVAATLKNVSNITVSSFRYNSDQRELMMNIEAGSFDDLEKLRSNVTERGFVAELLRVEARGDKQSARMKVTEAQP
ncbi:general secretion pathway protein L [Alteromonadaceae bacterium 2753L.S.0a.02]|nr:general secretion pathway protein L [Alteromonadaceae bacterium 2753L.S.0a.02]